MKGFRGQANDSDHSWVVFRWKAPETWVHASDSDMADGMTLALIDEAYLTLLYPAWVEFAYANEETLLSRNFSQLRESTGRAHPRFLRSVSGWFEEGDATLEDYYITDMLSLSANISSAQSGALSAALDQAIALPCISVMVTSVLLKEERMWAWPRSM